MALHTGMEGQRMYRYGGLAEEEPLGPGDPGPGLCRQALCQCRVSALSP